MVKRRKVRSRRRRGGLGSDGEICRGEHSLGRITRKGLQSEPSFEKRTKIARFDRERDGTR